MTLLLDTQLLLWMAFRQAKLSTVAKALMSDDDNILLFSTISLVEVAIKRALNKPDFQVDPRILRDGLIEYGHIELPVLGEHALALERLPSIHKDPFDRLLVAQAMAEGITLLTNDTVVARYAGPVRLV